MKPRVYIAAPWVRKQDAAKAAAGFKLAGFKITHKWWEHDDVSGYGGDCSPEELFQLQEQADADYNGVINADVFVVLNLEKSEGKAVETGIAIEAGLPIIAVGPLLNLFQYMNQVTKVGTVEEAIEEAKKYVYQDSVGSGSDSPAGIGECPSEDLDSPF